MKSSLLPKLAFWAAILVTTLWLVLSIAIGAAAVIQFFAGGFIHGGHSLAEAPIVIVLVLQPLFILFLIVRAVRLRNDGQPLRAIARALVPLALAFLLIGDFKALEYLRYQSEWRLVLRRYMGTITYLCWMGSPEINQNAGTPDLRLTEHRSPEHLGTWIVGWPGKKAIDATSFHARTGSYGGSQGIQWREPNGHLMIAYLSFSDVVNERGPAEIWGALDRSGKPTQNPKLEVMRPDDFRCVPDKASYHE